MRSKRITVAVAVGVCLVLCLRIFFARYAIVNVWTFHGPVSKDAGAGTRATVMVHTKTKVPKLLASTIRMPVRSTLPHDLVLWFDTGTATATLRTAVLDRVAIRYQNGPSVEVVNPERKVFWPFEMDPGWPNWDGRGIVYHESLAAGGTFTNCVDRNTACTIDCRGFLVDDKGNASPFLLRWCLQPRNVWGIVPSAYLDEGVISSPLPKP